MPWRSRHDHRRQSLEWLVEQEGPKAFRNPGDAIEPPPGAKKQSSTATKSITATVLTGRERSMVMTDLRELTIDETDDVSGAHPALAAFIIGAAIGYGAAGGASVDHTVTNVSNMMMYIIEHS